MFILCRENLIAIVIEIAIVIVIEIVIAIVIERLYRKLVVSREEVFDD
jgi:site-specific recombinase